MILQLTGTITWWMLLLPALFLSAAAIWIYRQHNPPAPWDRILPALRILAILCLLFSLLRPILARVTSINIRGRIPVIIDDSGSMKLEDQYEDHEAVKIAWNLDWFPREKRLTHFETPPENMRKIAPALTNIFSVVREALGSTENDSDFRKAWRDVESETKHGANSIDRFLVDLLRDVDKAGYTAAGETINSAGDGMLFERYDKINGVNLADLENAEKFPDKPDYTEVREDFSIPANSGDNYGSKLSGYLRPALSGDYVFSMTSDDAAALYYRTLESSQELTPIITIDGWKQANDWSSVSKPVRLESDRVYYFEARHKEGSGGDHLAVGWKRPDDKVERPVPGKLFSPQKDSSGSFAFQLTQWQQAADNLSEAIRKLSDEAHTFRTGQTEDISAPAEAASRAAEFIKTWYFLLNEFKELQIAADRHLAQAKEPEVDAALKKLKETSRWQLAMHILSEKSPGLIQALEEKGTVDLFTMNEAVIEPVTIDELRASVPERANTRLGSILHKILQHYENSPLAAVCVITDGRINAGLPLSAAREIAVERKLPLIALGIGAEKPPQDIAIESVVVPETAFKDDMIKTRIVIHRNGFEDREIPLTIRRGERIMHEEKIPPGKDSRITIETAFEEDENGQHRYVAEIPEIEQEALSENNRRSFHVNVLEDKIRTLMVDEFPRWESRYLRMMLSRDRRVELDTVFISSSKEGRLIRTPGAWPESRQALFGYQTVILGDVNPEHFSGREMHDLHDFVSERGGTLIILAGPDYMPARYAGTPLAEIMPFQWSNLQTDKTEAFQQSKSTSGKIIQHRLKLTQAGSYDTLPQISRETEMNQQLWQRLPGVNWVAPGIRAVPAADLLAVTEHYETPVLLRGFAGAGRVLYVGADTFWRWRDRTRWHYHHRFWGQIMLWSAIGRTSGSDAYVKMATDRPRYASDEVIMINVRLLNKEKEPIENAQAVVDVIDEDGERVREVPLLPAATGAGEYRGEVTALPHGHFKLVPRVFELRDQEVNAALEIDIGDVLTGEYVHLSLDRPRLEEWATEYRPAYNPLAGLDEIEPVDLTEEQRREFEQPLHALLLLIAALALGAEWHFRKRCRLP